MIKTILIAATVSVLFISCAAEDLHSETIDVGTAVCGSCGQNIEKAVYAVEGVKAAEFDLKAKTVLVKYVPAQTNLATLERAISYAGYDANKTPRDPAGYETLDACCRVD